MNLNPGTIIGKTVNACISRPGPGQMSRVYMMMFTDGSCYEFVSGKSPSSKLRQSGNGYSNGLSVLSIHESEAQSKQLSLSGF